MYKIWILTGCLLGLLGAASFGAQGAEPNAPAAPAQTGDANELETVLARLQERAGGLQSYQARVDYLFKQPLLESQQRRQGTLQYARFDNRSYLRIDFTTLQQDEEKEQKYGEQFFFDGIWLWHIDHQTKTVERHQMAEPNQPVDALALASKQVPVLGFAKVEDLRKQFEVTLVPFSKPDTPFYHLHLKVKPDSVYKDDYTTVDLLIDKNVGLPARIDAATTEEDVYEIRLLDPKVNAPIDRNVFKVNVPSGFSVQVIPLEKTGRRSSVDPAPAAVG
jgi:outer membrane lipoprotein-sorting protein